MSLLFDDASSQYIHFVAVPVSDYPFSLVCWFRTDDLTVNQMLIQIHTEFDTRWLGALHIRGGEDDTLRAYTKGGSSAQFAKSSIAVTVNTWHAAVGVFVARDDVTVYLDGGNSGTHTSDPGTMPSMDMLTIGRDGDSTPSSYMSGRIAECMLLNVALTADEAKALSLGILARHLRPTNIKGDWPLLGLESPEPDYSSLGNSLTLFNGPVKADHAPVTLLTPKWAASVPLIEAAAGGGFAHTQTVFIA